MLSNLTGTWMTDEEATDPNRWGSPHPVHPCGSPTNSTPCLKTRTGCWSRGGPGWQLDRFGIAHSGLVGNPPFGSLDAPLVQTRDDRDVFLLALGQLWAAGVDVEWSRLYGEHPRRVTLPGYAFARQRYWIDPDTSSAPRTAGSEIRGDHRRPAGSRPVRWHGRRRRADATRW